LIEEMARTVEEIEEDIQKTAHAIAVLTEELYPTGATRILDTDRPGGVPEFSGPAVMHSMQWRAQLDSELQAHRRHLREVEEELEQVTASSVFWVHSELQA
jgi:hypothetical protein